jgi:Beta xylosidase C-terminal Concanavalin A-like domain
LREPHGLAKLFCAGGRVCYAAAMRRGLFVFFIALALTAAGAELRFDFSDWQPDALPTNFQAVVAGDGPPGVWKIVEDEVPSQFQSYSNQPVALTRHGVLAQTSTDMTDEHFPMLLYTGEKFRNFKFTTQFKIVSGIAEQMAGVVFRYQNASNYYVVRASALGKNVRFYKVIDGFRSDPIGPDLEVTTNVWHSLAVQCDGTQINVWFDDKPVMPALGDNSLNVGLIGFRTKSDAVVYFTGATVEYTPVVPGAQALVENIMKEQSRLLGLRIYTLQTNGTTAVVGSSDTAELGKLGTDAELKAIQEGAVFYGKETKAVVVTMPLHDRNGEFIAAVRVRLRTFFGETRDNAVTRARMLVNLMQDRVGTAEDLE